MEVGDAILIFIAVFVFAFAVIFDNEKEVL